MKSESISVGEAKSYVWDRHRFQRQQKRAKNQISDEYLLTFDFYGGGEEILQICQGGRGGLANGHKPHMVHPWSHFCKFNIEYWPNPQSDKDVFKIKIHIYGKSFKKSDF